MVDWTEIVAWAVAGLPLLGAFTFIFGVMAKDYAREYERCRQEKLRLENEAYRELEELKGWLKALHQEHRMIREDIEQLKAAVEELRKEKCKVVEVVRDDQS